jgi:EAL domain-containing protein (putative c-di-GMP-specific phosphodiesterase class I)
MADPPRSAEIFAQLRAMGVKISIDDFGSGYSSLAYLKQLPVDELKIDRSFVIGIAPSAEEIAIVRSAIEIGHSLGLKVVAEGVETQAAWDILAELGCDTVQGYLITRPLPARQLGRWLAAGWAPRAQDLVP